jgi:glycosyltransferase involved in cell wall biosynthesis
MCPLVSVCVITCNQERYIRECLDSIVSQRVDFPIEVIVGDDCSTDSTPAIIDEFLAAYPSVVRAIVHKSRVGATHNLLSAHSEAVGEFIAHVDGDDCMLPGKLQRQADFLRAHSDYAMVAHDTQLIDADSRVIARTFASTPVPESFDINYLVANGCVFTHSSKMYRRSAARTRHRERLTVDMYFHIEHARHGRIGYIAEALGQYRKTEAGMSFVRSTYRLEVLRAHLDAFEYALTSGVAAAIVDPARLKFRYVEAMTSIRAGRFAEFRFLTTVPASELRAATPRQRALFRLPAVAVYLGCAALDAARGLARGRTFHGG